MIANAVSAASKAEPAGLLISWAMPAASSPTEASRSFRRDTSSRAACWVISRTTAMRCVSWPDGSRTGSDRRRKAVRQPFFSPTTSVEKTPLVWWLSFKVFPSGSSCESEEEDGARRPTARPDRSASGWKGR